jgi:hypothetical protein
MPSRFRLVENSEGKMEMVEVGYEPNYKQIEPVLISTETDAFKSRRKFEKLPKFCIFCKKAGYKYDDHFMRKDGRNDGEIVCVRIKSSTCSNCGQVGHTKSYCTNKKINFLSCCQYCVSNGVPEKIAQSHTTYDIDTNGQKIINCPLLYKNSLIDSFNYETEKSGVSDNSEHSSSLDDSFMSQSPDEHFMFMPKMSEEPVIGQNSKFKQIFNNVGLSQESDTTRSSIFCSEEFQECTLGRLTDEL